MLEFRNLSKYDWTNQDVVQETPVLHTSRSEVFLLILQLLSKPKFSGVEKIKTIGSTYMAAAGLSGTPGQENNQVQRPRPPIT